MDKETMLKRLDEHKANIAELNAELQKIEQRKNEIITEGLRLEGSIKELEKIIAENEVTPE